MQRLHDDVGLREVHLAMLPASPRRSENAFLATGLAKLDEAQTVEQAVASLTNPEKSAVLGDPAGIARLIGLS
jgi:membrane glycosyltransferase